MDDSLLEVVLARLDHTNHRLDDAVEALVLAALDSDEALAEVMGGGAIDKARPKLAGTDGEDAAAPKMASQIWPPWWRRVRSRPDSARGDRLGYRTRARPSDASISTPPQSAAVWLSSASQTRQ